MVYHELEPIYDTSSKILILGSMPSITSRKEKFYYAHPANRFWHVFEILYQTKLDTISAKKEFLYSHYIALWDVIYSCNIKNSSDSTIKDVTYNDIPSLLAKTKIKKIYCLGRKAYDLYEKNIYLKTNIHATYLPSTSPLNASLSLEDLVRKYAIVLDNK